MVLSPELYEVEPPKSYRKTPPASHSAKVSTIRRSRDCFHKAISKVGRYLIYRNSSLVGRELMKYTE